MGFRNLWVKEIRGNWPIYGVFAVLVVLLHAVLLYKRHSLPGDSILVFALVIPFLFASAIAIGLGYYQLHTEWRTNSIYLLLSLPIRGWKVMTAKLAAVMTLLAISLVWMGASFSLILLRLKWAELMENVNQSETWPIFFRIVFNSAWMYLLILLFLLSLTQFTFLCGQLVAKLKWVFMICAFFGALWLFLRVSPLLSGLLLWMPEIVFGDGGSDTTYLHSGPFIVLLAACVGLTALNGYIFEKEVEV